MDIFDQKRKKAFETDRSNRGMIDSSIKGVVDAINSRNNAFTTSSCSGRLMVIQKRGKKTDSRILFCSHEKVTDTAQIKGVLEYGGDTWLIYNPAILHVSCRTVDDAIQLFTLARKAGFKRTGIISAKSTVMVEIMGTDHIETLLCDDEGCYFTEEGLQKHLDYACIKFDKNIKKIKSFEELLK